MCYLQIETKDIGARRNTIFPTRRLESGVKMILRRFRLLCFTVFVSNAYSAAF